MLLNEFLRGILLGLAVSVSIGPAFFSIIQTSIQRGSNYGVSMAVGILLSDATLITVSLLGLSSFINDPEYKVYIGLIGGIILILYGLYSFMITPIDPYAEKTETQKKKLNILKKYMGPDAKWPIYLIKGFFMNLLNPFLLIFWLTAVGAVGASASENEFQQTILFFAGTLSTTFSLDLLKAYLGNKIKSIINFRVIVLSNKIIGVIFVLFGFGLILRLFIS